MAEGSAAGRTGVGGAGEARGTRSAAYGGGVAGGAAHAGTASSPGKHVTLAELGASGVAHERVKQKEAELKELLARQASLARELRRKADVLAADTHAMSKNLEAAIAQARIPGYWKTHVPSAEVAKLEKAGLTADVAALAKVQEDIDRVSAEMRRAAERPARSDADTAARVTTLKDWFRVNGKASSGYGGPGYASELDPPTRVYGGTKHYPGFRSVAQRLRPGRALK
jgi:hypothetical protein